MGFPKNCKKIQENILTDYIDGCLEKGQKSIVDRHLKDCSACGEFLVSLKEVTGPLQNAAMIVPESSLWLRIKESIEDETAAPVENNFLVDYWEKIRSLVFVPRPAFALATFLTVIFMAGTADQMFMNNHLAVNINGPDQIEYMSSLINDTSLTQAGNDSQTPIEKYFL